MVICSDVIETVSLSGYTKLSDGIYNGSKTLLTKYRNQTDSLQQSLHEFFHLVKNKSSRQGREYVPHYVGGSGQPIFPISENYAQIELTKHKPWSINEPLPLSEDMINIFKGFLEDP
jgi:hypothetical protein